jgi:hypothetical protein
MDVGVLAALPGKPSACSGLDLSSTAASQAQVSLRIPPRLRTDFGEVAERKRGRVGSSGADCAKNAGTPHHRAAHADVDDADTAMRQASNCGGTDSAMSPARCVASAQVCARAPLVRRNYSRSQSHLRAVVATIRPTRTACRETRYRRSARSRRTVPQGHGDAGNIVSERRHQSRRSRYCLTLCNALVTRRDGGVSRVAKGADCKSEYFL